MRWWSGPSATFLYVITEASSGWRQSLDAERSKCTKWLEGGELWCQSDDVSVMTYNKTALGYHHQSAHGQFTDSLQNIVSQNLKNNFDNRYNSFAISCKKVLDKIVPWKKNWARGNHSPFISKVPSKAIMVRTKLRNTFQKNRSKENKKSYNIQQNYCVSLLWKSKRDYYNNLNKKNICDTWTFGK